MVLWGGGGGGTLYTINNYIHWFTHFSTLRGMSCVWSHPSLYFVGGEEKGGRGRDIETGAVRPVCCHGDSYIPLIQLDCKMCLTQRES